MSNKLEVLHQLFPPGGKYAYALSDTFSLLACCLAVAVLAGGVIGPPSRAAACPFELASRNILSKWGVLPLTHLRLNNYFIYYSGGKKFKIVSH